MPEVEEYRFGYIRIAGEEYTRDVIVYPDRVRPNWWRKEGHSLCLEDIREVLEFKPEVIVIGTGAYGVMRVPDEVVRELERRGIRVIVAPTSEAVRTFNELLRQGKRVVGCFHLTC